MTLPPTCNVARCQVKSGHPARVSACGPFNSFRDGPPLRVISRHPTVREARDMDIGKPSRTFTIEPVEDPVPREQPLPPAEQDPPEPLREPEEVPAP